MINRKIGLITVGLSLVSLCSYSDVRRMHESEIFQEEVTDGEIVSIILNDDGYVMDALRHFKLDKSLGVEGLKGKLEDMKGLANRQVIFARGNKSVVYISDGLGAGPIQFGGFFLLKHGNKFKQIADVYAKSEIYNKKWNGNVAQFSFYYEHFCIDFDLVTEELELDSFECNEKDSSKP